MEGLQWTITLILGVPSALLIVLLQAPPDRAAIDTCLERLRIPEREVLGEFYGHFYKLQNAMDV